MRDRSRILGLYLPARSPLTRQGFLRVDGVVHGNACTIAAAQFGRSLEVRLRQLRFARARMLDAAPRALFFCCGETTDLFERMQFKQLQSGAAQTVYARGFEGTELRGILNEL